jgi:hypothetical protein
MWFKTRVGLCAVLEPFEILVARYNEETPHNYSIYARTLKDRTSSYQGIFGKSNTSNPATHLARFIISDSTGSAVAQCMNLIVQAVSKDAKMCDLSAAGDGDAWPAEWTRIEWRT